jgi:twitching motility protein PilT
MVTVDLSEKAEFFPHGLAAPLPARRGAGILASPGPGFNRACPILPVFPCVEACLSSSAGYTRKSGAVAQKRSPARYRYWGVHMDIAELLAFAFKHGASDLHLSSGLPPMIRVDGDIKRINIDPLDDRTVHNMIYDIMNDKQQKDFEEFLETDFSFEIPNLARFRVNSFNQNRGPAAVFRTIPSKILSLEQLNAPDGFKGISEQPRGIVLVTGPTGSGKSTTLAAMINHVNETKHDHILTIEDPIEFVHTSKSCLVNQREVGRDTLGFNEALRSALREDPDIILVGEMRDLETIRLALTAAETGHLVFGTLHTSSAAKTIDRIVDVFPAAEKDMVRAMLSESLRAVISQTLLKKIGGGRVAAHEIMIGTPAIRNLIREGKVAQMYSAIQTSQSVGMQTLDQCLLDLVRNRQVTPEAARVRAVNKDLFASTGAASAAAGARA